MNKVRNKEVNLSLFGRQHDLHAESKSYESITGSIMKQLENLERL